ncbi:hypothetical protein PR202_gb09651 [Eleusine coracana subsp. coracana]|uniref:Uncharacterized protein n=1 Tax=Eleusine coracana subsp. coracana TaxID=191504 RepID=A0AAV5EHL9_ELECO|nr:hypothetical protein PR202_gb09651 [Eleusine coracana subsp. coracana]
MVWKSWGGSLVSVLILVWSLMLLLLVASSSLLCSGAVIFSETPRRVSGSSSAFFAFRVVQSGGVSCLGCVITCKVTIYYHWTVEGRRSAEGAPESYTGLKDGSHSFAVCVTAAACATYAWDVDTVPPTASVTAGSAFTSASNVSVLISFSEPCPGAGGFTCNNTYCNLIAYGPGRVEPSTLEVLQPGLRYSILVTISPDEQYGRLILVMDRAFCTDAAGHRFTRTSNSSFTLRFDKRNDSMNITTGIPEKLLRMQGVTRLVQATNDANELRIYLSFAQPVLNSSDEILSVLKATHDAVLTPTSRSTLGNRRFGYVVNKVSDTAIVTVSCDTSSIISRQGTPVDSASAEPFTFLYDSVPASSSSIATVTTIVFVATAVVATLLTVSTSSLVASGAISRPSSHMISEPSRNLVRMACHIQMFALSRWMSVNLPIEYYEFAKGIEWSIPYMPLPWEGPAADPFMGYSTMPVVAYSELVDRSAVGAADISYPRAQQSQPAAMPTEIPGDDGGMKPIMMPPMQTIPLDGKPLSAMEYRSFFENPDMKPEADIIMKKLQDLDVWKQFGRNMLWLGVIGGGLILAHAVTLAYLKLRYKRGGRAEQHEETRKGYGALVFPRLEMMVVILAMPCISQAAATMISRGMDRGVACVGIVLLGILACLLLGLVLFLWLGIIIGMVQQVQYEEDELEEEEESTRRYQWCQEVILGPAFRRGHWTSCTGLSNKLGPLFEDLRGPPAPPNQDNKERTMDKLLGVVRIHYTFFECLKRIIVAATIATAASWVPASMASLQLLFLVVTKPFIKKRVQLVEMVSLASEVFVFAC